MSKRIFTFHEIIELNHLLEEQELRFKVHLQDACGSQSFRVEPLGNSDSDEHYNEMLQVVSKYFEEKNAPIRFLENQLDFIII